MIFLEWCRIIVGTGWDVDVPAGGIRGTWNVEIIRSSQALLAFQMMVMPVRCVPLTATHCHLRLAWSREHALWTPQQWSCVMFSDESRFSLQSDSRRTFIWRAPDTRYHQENTIERHRYGGAG
ncbi:hypothetical protein AVEN_26632-1 [Araneus ventricosus]|uniref:Transposase Tc1-like domain-containing protein n=1 Tax=Araneus ventricosus TaxID=182803 RepID=A0A4Y2NIW0_ARAVE|nr:hypothetical protein AVEN_26632-1 [Araneus ventricosus]